MLLKATMLPYKAVPISCVQASDKNYKRRSCTLKANLSLMAVVNLFEHTQCLVLLSSCAGQPCQAWQQFGPNMPVSFTKIHWRGRISLMKYSQLQHWQHLLLLLSYAAKPDVMLGAVERIQNEYPKENAPSTEVSTSPSQIEDQAQVICFRAGRTYPLMPCSLVVRW